jgi:hypothetical protein
MNGPVQKALDDIKACFKPKDFEVEPDGAGGARVRFGPVKLSKTYQQRETWVAGHVPPQVPYADIYPVFVRGDLARADGAALAAPITPGHIFMGQPAVQVSRRSNRRDPAFETAALKFMKVIDWLNSQ